MIICETIFKLHIRRFVLCYITFSTESESKKCIICINITVVIGPLKSSTSRK